MLIVVDTNVIVSAFIAREGRGAPAAVMRNCRDQRFSLVVTPEILEEYRNALTQSHIMSRHGRSAEGVNTAITAISKLAEIVHAGDEAITASRDPDDNKFLACAVAASADYIVSGDKDLLSLGSFRGIPILPPAVFVAMLESGTAL